MVSSIVTSYQFAISIVILLGACGSSVEPRNQVESGLNRFVPIDKSNDINLRIRADSLFLLGLRAIEAESNVEGMELLKQAVSVCNSISDGYPEVRAPSLSRISSKARNLYMTDTMTKYGDLALDALRDEHAHIGDSLVIEICGDLIQMCRGMHRLEEARHLTLMMTEAANRTKEPRDLVFALKTAALVYKDLGDFRLAIAYGMDHIAKSHELNMLNPRAMLQSHQLIGECYLNIRIPDSTLVHYRKAWGYEAAQVKRHFNYNKLYLSIHMILYFMYGDTQPDSILHYVQKAEQILGNDNNHRSASIRAWQLRPMELSAYALTGQVMLADSLARDDLRSVLDLNDPNAHVQWDSIPEPTSVSSQLGLYASVFTSIYYNNKSPRFARTILRLYDEIERFTNKVMKDGDPRLLLKDALHLHRINDNRLLVLYDMGEERPVNVAGLAALFEERKSLQMRAALKAELDQFYALGGSDELEALYANRSAIEHADTGLDSAALAELVVIDNRISEIRASYLGMRARNGAIPGPERWDSLMKALDPSTMLINYAWTDSILLILAMTRHSHSFEYRRIYPWLEEAINEALERIRGDASEHSWPIDHIALSDTLLPVSLDWRSMDKLIIIPDGKLNAFPFEALRFRSNGEVRDMIESKVIRYEYCQSFLANPYRPRSGVDLAVGFAPAYEELADTSRVDQLASRDGGHLNAYGSLTGNREEVTSIGDLVQMQVFLGDNATELAARSLFDQARLLHLAAHSFCSDLAPEWSGIIFNWSRDRQVQEIRSDSDDVLYAYEIQGLDLGAEMIVLSGCETAVGDDRKGEGAMSLARVFKYAGAGSVVSSLWKVDDLATKQIMVKFYEHLAEGLGKADALAEAKRWYRREFPNEPPSKWAAFVLIGDNEPVQLRRPMRTVYWALGLALVGIFGGALWFRSRRKAA
ncbi:MAG: CHAT domain-containing protein [Nitrospira sp.]|nr:CHAT domain-containing protein [Nitrospira sp.]